MSASGGAPLTPGLRQSEASFGAASPKGIAQLPPARSSSQERPHLTETEERALKSRMREMKEQLWLLAGRFQKAEEENAALHNAVGALTDDAVRASTRAHFFENVAFDYFFTAESDVREVLVESAMESLAHIYAAASAAGLTTKRFDITLREFWQHQQTMDGRQERHRSEQRRRAAAETRLLAMDLQKNAMDSLRAESGLRDADAQSSGLPAERTSTFGNLSATMKTVSSTHSRYPLGAAHRQFSTPTTKGNVSPVSVASIDPRKSGGGGAAVSPFDIESEVEQLPGPAVTPGVVPGVVFPTKPHTPDPGVINFLSKVYAKHLPDHLPLVAGIAELWSGKEVRLLDDLQSLFNLTDDEVENLEIDDSPLRGTNPITLNEIDLDDVKRAKNGGLSPITIPADDDGSALGSPRGGPPPSPVSLRPIEAEGVFRAIYAKFDPAAFERQDFRRTLTQDVEQYTIRGRGVFNAVCRRYDISDDDFRGLVAETMAHPASSRLSRAEAQRLIERMLRQRKLMGDPASPPASPSGVSTTTAGGLASPSPAMSPSPARNTVQTRDPHRARSDSKPPSRPPGSEGGLTGSFAGASTADGSATAGLPTYLEACEEYAKHGDEYLTSLKEVLGLSDSRYELLLHEATRAPLTRFGIKKLLKLIFAEHDPERLPNPDDPNDHLFDSSLLAYAREGEQYLEKLKAQYNISEVDYAHFVSTATRGRWTYNEASKLVRLIYAAYDAEKLNGPDHAPVFNAVDQYMQNGEDFLRQLKIAYQIPEPRFQAWGKHAQTTPFTPAEAAQLIKMIYRRCDPSVFEGAERPRELQAKLHAYAKEGDGVIRNLAASYGLPRAELTAMVKEVTKIVPVFPVDIARFTRNHMLYLVTKIYERYEPAKVADAKRLVGYFLNNESVLLMQLKRMYKISNDEAKAYVEAADTYNRVVKAAPPVTRNLALLTLQTIFSAVDPDRVKTAEALVNEWVSRESKLLEMVQVEYGLSDGQMDRFRSRALTRGASVSQSPTTTQRRITAIAPSVVSLTPSSQPQQPARQIASTVNLKGERSGSADMPTRNIKKNHSGGGVNGAAIATRMHSGGSSVPARASVGQQSTAASSKAVRTASRSPAVRKVRSQKVPPAISLGGAPASSTHSPRMLQQRMNSMTQQQVLGGPNGYARGVPAARFAPSSGATPPPPQELPIRGPDGQHTWARGAPKRRTVSPNRGAAVRKMTRRTSMEFPPAQRSRQSAAASNAVDRSASVG